MRRLFVAVFVLAALAVAAGDAPPSILFLASSEVSQKEPGNVSKYLRRKFLPDEKFQKSLADAGYVWAGDFVCTGMTPEWLRQFNVVVLLDFPIPEKSPGAEDKVLATLEMLRQYVKDGGGLLMTGATEGGMWALEKDKKAMTAWLAPFGGKVLYEGVTEENAALDLGKPHPKAPSAVAWTGNVAKCPLTEGVEGFVYPTGHAWTYYCNAIEVDDSWQVLLRGSPTATTYTVPLGTSKSRDPAARQPGAAGNAPAMLAVRQVDKGRLALWPTAPTITIIDGYHPFWRHGMAMAGTGSPKPSNGERLLLNLFAWLSEPSRGTFGPYEPPPAKEEKETESGLVEINWDMREPNRKPFPLEFTGILGLRSNLSVGQADPQAMIDAARAAGYDFAAFGEDLGKLTAEKWTQLKDVCAKNWTDDFRVYPGFVFKDGSGNDFLTFAPRIDWPQDDWWHDPATHSLSRCNVIYRGFQNPPLILLHPNTNPEPPWLQGDFKGLAVFTYENGKLVDDATAVHRQLADENFKVWPAAVHLVDTPAAVAAAAETGMQMHLPWFEFPNLLEGMSHGHCKYGDGHIFQWPSYVSDGPTIDAWNCMNFGTSDLAVRNGERMRLYLHARSDAGIRQVEIWDGPKLYRRIVLDNPKEYELSQDAFHGDKHAFIAVVTDDAGKRAVTADRWTGVQEVGLVRCTDNLNTFVGGKYQGVRYHAVRGLENYIDSQAGSFQCLPYVKDFEPLDRWAVEQRIERVNRFGYQHRLLLTHYYPPTASGNWNATDQPELAKPQDAFAGMIDIVMWTRRADGTAIYTVDGYLEALSDIELPANRISVFRSGWTDETPVTYVSPKEGKPYCLVMRPRKNNTHGSLDGVEYVAQLAAFGGSRALIPMGDGLWFQAMRSGGGDGDSYLGAFLELGGTKVEKGRRLPFRYLTVWGPIGGAPDNTFVEQVCEQLGLRGKTAYTVEPTVGSVTDTRFTLTLATDNHGFAGRIGEAQLPLRLPVLVNGLVERWPAAIWYQGKNVLEVPVWGMNAVGLRETQYERRQGRDQIQHFSVKDGLGMLQVDTKYKDKDVFIGNLLVCENPEVFLELEDWRPGKVTVVANNPLATPVKITVRPGPGFTLCGDFALPMTLKPGELRRLVVGQEE